MREASEHLTVPEILRLLLGHAHSGDEVLNQELKHLDQCDRCRQVKEDYRLFMSKLPQSGKTGHRTPPDQCPPPSIWGAVAAGMVPQQDAFKYLEHSGACAACAEELQSALYALDENAPMPAAIQSNLETASEAWQKSFAARLESQTSAAPIRSFTSTRQNLLRQLISRPWAIAALAAIVLLTIGLGIFSSQRRGSPDTLIRQAYAQQRTIEMRIPGADYGPVQVERASGNSSISSPRPLLEAQVLIKSGLEKSPDDPELLRQKAEADLLAWNYQPALETLNHAARLRPDSFSLLVDTATAYFERAEANSSPADYEAGLEALGKAIRLEPSNPAALFNRAILYERLYFYDRAIADWEQLLKIEPDAQWKEEAERRLKEIRSRHDHGTRLQPDKLPLNSFQQSLDAGNAAAIEEYVEAAERNILPQIAAPDSHDEHYQASAALARKIQVQHSDPFLTDLLASAGQRDFQRATLSLAQSSSANHSGHFEQAYDEASRAAALFRKSGNSAGWLASLFEQAYALQFESQASDCRRISAVAAADAARLNYAYLQTQLLLEHAICSNMSGALGPAKEITQHALTVARSHSYQSLYLRGLNLLAGLESDAGDDTAAWSAVQEGLALYWKSGLPPVRAYSFYAVLDRMAERRGHANVQFAALSEALKFRAENSNRVVEAAARARLGDAALRLGDLPLAEEQFAQAERLFAAEPPSDSVRWRQLEAHIHLARVQSLRGADTNQIAASLAASLPEVQGLSNHYVEFLYYDTLAELKMRAGDTTSARRLLQQAINISETGAASLSTWREKLAWMEWHRAPFARMASLLLSSGQSEQALVEWQRYRIAGPLEPAPLLRDIKNHPGSLLQSVSATKALPLPYVLTYAFVPSGLIIWVRHGQEIHAVQTAISSHDLQRTAESFISECARPGSDLADLHADGHTLYQWLVQPVRQWLSSSGHLIIEPDGVVSAIPLDALIDGNSDYLGSHYTISIALNQRANDAARENFSIASAFQALIVAAPAAPNGPPAPPPGALAEATHVAAHFTHPVLLMGRDAGTAQVAQQLARTNLFHFAGHAGYTRNGAALLLADGVLQQKSTTFPGTRHLHRLQLAVFSACATARQSETSDSRSLVSDFLQSGAHSVAASRWNVDSVATESFMLLFYDSLLSGHAPAEALQSAANSLRQIRGRSHPYYWAAFASFGSV